MSDSKSAGSGVIAHQCPATKVTKLYEGKRDGLDPLVTVNGLPLEPRLDLWNHSPTGFDWGYGGSGPAQLALALLADHLGDDDEAVELHQDFKRAVIARLPYRAWLLTSDDIRQAVVAMTAPTLSMTPLLLNDKNVQAE